MADTGDTPSVLASAPEHESPRRRRRRWRRLWQVLAGFVVVVVIAAIGLWTQRERIADNVIARELNSRGIPATYVVQRIGGRRQVLRDIVVGRDPRRPDLTVERAEVRIRYTLGWPTIGRITLTRPRLYGTYRRGTLTFGTLDPLIFREPTEKKFELPDLDLRILDGRALLDSDYGPVGFKAEGAGNLRDGFKGVLAIAAPRLAGYGCSAERASYYGTIAIDGRRPRLQGPLRLSKLGCPERELALADAAMRLDARLDEDITAGEGEAKLVSGAFAFGENLAANLAADARLTYRNRALTMRLEARAGEVATPALALATLSTEGTLRARDGFDRIEYQGSLAGAGFRPGRGLDAGLAAVQASVEGTLLAPLIAQARRALLREGRVSRFSAQVDFSRTAQRYALVVPQAQLRGGSGATLLDVSRLQVNGGGTAAPRLSGNFASGGPGLPRIVGRMERSDRGNSVLRLRMAEYRAGSASLALPELVVAQARDGSLGFVGAARASGALPGGSARNLVLPIEGTYSASGELALFRRCTTFRAEQLTLANLTLERRSLTLCPQRGAPIVRAGPAGLRLAFGAPSLDLAGRFGQTPVRMVSGPVGFAYPGVMSVRGLNVTLGPAANPNRFRLANLEARVGREVTGRFTGAEALLAAVDFDIVQVSGRFRYAGGRLAVSDADMAVVDRRVPSRFEPLVARDATLTLTNNRIDMNALLREPTTDRAVTRAVIRHQLNTGRGHADLFVEDLQFDEMLQPATLSRLALGNIANVRGAVSGVGRFDWSPAGITSTGTFSTESLDFAAAFGPVRGLSGTVNFTDLLGFVTAPDQEVRIASMNPGIEVTEGLVRFELLPGGVLRLKSATWPFLGGTLTLAPTDLRLGVSEARRYTLIIEGLDAARFVERMGLANISATGIFDGELPLVFSAASGTEQVGAAVGTILGLGTPEGVDAAASTPGTGRIVGGKLESRPPGGNVSYIGELTYRDLSPMANFTFQTLRSLDYEHMTITFNGALEGEIVTSVRFDGVRQGPGAKRNILTRAVADLPIRMIVNIRAPFYQLITSFKALYDPAFVKDPRILGLIDEKGRPIRDGQPVVNPPPTPSANIQPSESETVR